jgi:hypothetical protein
MIYTDQTDRFPVVPRQGHKYIIIMVLYEVFEPMKSHEEGKMIRTYKRLKSQGVKPVKQMLDNEAPPKYPKAIEDHGITWELVPPSNQVWSYRMQQIFSDA